MQAQDAFLDAVLHDQAVDRHRTLLPDAVRAVGGLVLDGGVPPGIEVHDIVGGGQVQSGAAGAQADQEQVGAEPAWNAATRRSRSFDGVLPSRYS